MTSRERRIADFIEIGVERTGRHFVQQRLPHMRAVRLHQNDVEARAPEMLAELLHESSGKAGGFVRVLCRQSGPVIHSPFHNGNGAGDLSQLYESAHGTLFLKNVHLLAPAAHADGLDTLQRLAKRHLRPAPLVPTAAPRPL